MIGEDLTDKVFDYILMLMMIEVFVFMTAVILFAFLKFLGVI